MSPQVYPDDLMRYVYGRDPALPTEPHPKHAIFCAEPACQQVARVKVDGIGHCDEHKGKEK